MDLAEWHKAQDVEPDQDGWYTPHKPKGSVPVSDEQYLENIRTNLKGDALTPKPYDPRTFVMVCGGPSLDETLDLLKERAGDKNCLIVCSNQTGEWLLSKGIVAGVHFMLDAKPNKAQDVLPGKTHPDTEYWVNVGCDVSVFETLESQGLNVKKFVALTGLGEDGKEDLRVARDAMKQAGVFNILAIGGGTMAGLRALTLADARGFRAIEYFGFDGNLTETGKAYAYDKRRHEDIVEVETPSGERYLSTPVLSAQATQLLHWRAEMPWMDITVRGPGFVGAMLNAQIAKERKPTVDRFSRGYAKLQAEMHANPDYGTSGATHAQTVFLLAAQLSKKHGAITVLDYGCGKQSLKAALLGKFPELPGLVINCYDPMISGLDEEPGPADIVVCTDVLEHVEPESTEAVLDHIQSLTKRVALLSVALTPALKTLPDGRNAHINLKPSSWWFKQIKKRFIPGEVSERGDFVVVAQSIEAVRAVSE